MTKKVTSKKSQVSETWG